MRTNRANWDYERKPGAHTQAENECLDWLENLYRWYDRGYITKSEMKRLAQEGPEGESRQPFPQDPPAWDVIRESMME